MVLANQNAKLTGPEQGFLVSPLVLTLKPWERGCTAEAPTETSLLAVRPIIQSDLVPVQPLQQPTTTEEPPVPVSQPTVSKPTVSKPTVSQPTVSLPTVSLPTPEIAQPVKITRSGRISKPPVRLNL